MPRTDPSDIMGSRRQRIPHLTSRAFANLRTWMLVLGIVIGLAFPFVLIVLNVPSQYTMRPVFFAACLLAGIVLAVANYALVRDVVGVRLQHLTRQMGYVGTAIREATYTGDWSACTPEACHLPVDSEDEFGDAARSFNSLVDALSASRDVQDASTDLTRVLSEHLEVADLTAGALAEFLKTAHAQAGAFCVIRDGELEVAASSLMRADALAAQPSVLAAMTGTRATVVDVPEDVVVEAVAVSFRPAAVVLVPVQFHSVSLGLVVIACHETPSPLVVSLVESYALRAGVALNNAITHERFQHLAAVDPLTGVYNRRFGLARMDEEWARAVRSATPLGALAFDLDHFKAVNDTHGHLVGDRVLRDVTAAARFALREGDVFVRTGGEEFLVVLPGANTQDVREVGERVRRSVADAVVPLAQGCLQVTVSLGGGSLPEARAASALDLLGMIDEALYASKRAGRNRLTMVG